MKMTPLLSSIVLAATAGVVHADGAFTLSGFGTLGAVQTSTNDAQFRSTYVESVGATKNIDLAVDSNLGIQGAYKISPKWMATVQVLSQNNRDDNWTPGVEWANLKYDVTPSFSLRAGRITAPFFLISDSRAIGYANNWVRSPVEVYAQVPISHIDGGDALWRIPIGDNTWTLQPYAGTGRFALYNHADGKAKNTFGLNTTFEMDSWLFRAGYVTTQLSISAPKLSTLYDALDQTAAAVAPFDPPLANSLTGVVSTISAVNKRSSFSGVGISYDNGDLFFQSEYTLRRSQSYVSDTNAWYATAGYHVGSLLPYLTYSAITYHNRNQQNAIPTTGVPPALVPTLLALQTGVAGAVAGEQQHDASIGVRWNAHKNMDIKAQFDRIQTDAGQSNFFAHASANFAGESVNVYSLAVDFVF